MSVGIAQATVNLSAAVTLGAVIGFERQWRQRLAGLRTNTLSGDSVSSPQSRRLAGMSRQSPSSRGSAESRPKKGR
jgi:hypothetical protein